MLSSGNDYDYITRTSQNQGILQKTGFVNQTNINPCNVWSLGLLQMDFFYRKREWYAGQFIRKVSAKFNLNEDLAHFFTTILNYQKPRLLSVLVRDIDKTFEETIVELPVINNDIAFDFMSDFAKEIKDKQINEIKNYLSLKKLSLGLTNDELKALNDFKTNKINWNEYKLDDLFFKVKINKTNKISSKIKKSGFELPALTSTTQNQGLSCYVSTHNATILKNIISIASNGECPVFYQSKSFTILQDAYAIKYKDRVLNDSESLFFVSLISKIMKKYNWDNKGSWEKVKNEKIKLPINNNKIDFGFINNFINFISKKLSENILNYK